jgi:hypothetical protein
MTDMDAAMARSADMHHCASCGGPIVRTYQGPYIDGLHHLIDCEALHAALIDYSIDDAEEERRDRG